MKWSLTWPWKREAKEITPRDLAYRVITYDVFKQVFGRTINTNKRIRLMQNLEPTGEQWELLLDMVGFVLSQMRENDSQQQRIRELFQVVQQGEAEMDFDTAALAASVMSYYLYPMQRGEEDNDYYVRLVEAVNLWRKSTGATN